MQEINLEVHSQFFCVIVILVLQAMYAQASRTNHVTPLVSVIRHGLPNVCSSACRPPWMLSLYIVRLRPSRRFPSWNSLLTFLIVRFDEVLVKWPIHFNILLQNVCYKISGQCLNYCITQNCQLRSLSLELLQVFILYNSKAVLM